MEKTSRLTSTVPKSIRDAQERAGNRRNGYGCKGELKSPRKVAGTHSQRTLNWLPVSGHNSEIQSQRTALLRREQVWVLCCLKSLMILPGHRVQSAHLVIFKDVYSCYQHHDPRTPIPIFCPAIDWISYSLFCSYSNELTAIPTKHLPSEGNSSGHTLSRAAGPSTDSRLFCTEKYHEHKDLNVQSSILPDLVI